jgi:hypothetical protein
MTIRLVYAWLVRLSPLLLAGALGISAACSDSTGPNGGCCKVCTTGKACGDSCIAASSTCNVGAGCACNGAPPL